MRIVNCNDQVTSFDPDTLLRHALKQTLKQNCLYMYSMRAVTLSCILACKSSTAVVTTEPIHAQAFTWTWAA